MQQIHRLRGLLGFGDGGSNGFNPNCSFWRVSKLRREHRYIPACDITQIKFKLSRHQQTTVSSSTALMSALFNFQSLLQVILLLICTCTYVHATWPALLDKNKTGALGVFWKFARIGERLSPYVAIGCFIMAFNVLSS